MRIIAHLDMDAFFAAIEERDNPRFQGKPLVVGADPAGGAGRGVVSTANYKAREYGIRSAMPISWAWRASEDARKRGLPPAIFVGTNMEKYAAVSERVMAILRKHAEHVEQASVDEAYFDLSFTGSYGKAEQLSKKIKEEIKAAEKLTCSIGIGPNKLIAKIASDFQKPDGLTVIEEGEKFLEPMSIRKLPGIGPKTEKKLNELGIKTIAQLKKLSKEKLSDMMGKWGAELYEKARARDDSPLVEEWEAKSIGVQETFQEDTLSLDFLRKRLDALCAEVHERFVQEKFKTFRTVVVTVRFSGFVTKTRSHTLAKPASDRATLCFEALKLLMPFLDARENPKRYLIRLIGVRVEKLA